jgi:hypothetical protein
LANVIKLSLAVIYECSYKDRVFFPGKPFQPCVMLVGKARPYPIEDHFKCSTQGQAPNLAQKQ